MIKEIRELTGLSYRSLAAWLGVSKSMVRFTEYGERYLQGEPSQKLTALTSVLQKLKDGAGESAQQDIQFTNAAKYADKHNRKMEEHRFLAKELQRRLNKLKLEQSRLTNRFVILNAMKELDTQLYSSTASDKEITGLLESFGREHLGKIAVKMEKLQDSIDIHLAYAEAHQQSLAKFKAMGK